MLTKIDGKAKTEIPYRDDFDKKTNTLTRTEVDAIIEYISSVAPKCLDSVDVIPAGWLGSGDWSGTPLQKLYEICGGLDKMPNERQQKRHEQWVQKESAMLFGHFVMLAAIQHQDEWVYNKDPNYVSNGVPIGSNIYWRKIKKFDSSEK